MKKRQEKEQMIMDRDNEIQKNKDEIDKASSDFARDLKIKLLTLQDKFDVAGGKEGSGEVGMLKKMDEIAGR